MKYSLLAFFIMAGTASAGQLEKRFASPPDSSRPFVFWYWMNGNISKEGIRADLDSFVKAGVGGAYLMNIGMAFPPGAIRFNTTEGVDIIKYAIRQAGQRGIQINLYNGAGWSASGGPWITPQYAMQKLTWSETQIIGGKSIYIKLKRPKVQKTYKPEYFEPKKTLDWYRDVAVLAFPTPVAEQNTRSKPVITASDPDFVTSKLMNDEPVPAVPRNGTYAQLATSKDAPGSLQWTYSEPFTGQSLRLEFQEGTSPSVTGGKLLCSDTGENWKEVCSFLIRSRMPVNVPFASTTARYWKVHFPINDGKAQMRLMSALLLPSYRIADWTAKAMFDDTGLEKPELPPPSKSAPPNSVIPIDSIINLTGKMDDQGRLQWEAPAGQWTILRFGRTPTGMCCRPAAHGGAGLECDKFSLDAIDLQWEQAVGPYLKDPLVAPNFQYVHIDSWEVYAQNWSKKFPQEFHSRIGYDLWRYLPVMTGRVVESLEISERFLWDLRAAISGLFDDYFARVQELCAKNGKKFTLEPYHQEQFNSCSAGTRADIPMCEIWRADFFTPQYWAKLGSSPAHVSGMNLVACESFTSNLIYADGGDWSKDYFDLKLTAHAILCGGVNMMVFHVSAHNPWPDVVPGMTVGPCGQHFEHSNPIWGKARGFTDFIARSQYILRQGRFIADVLYCCGENSPSKSLVVKGDLEPGNGYDYDICSPEIIIERLKAHDNRLILPHGGSYQLLVLPASDTMSLKMVRKLKELIKDGATVIASKPYRVGGLSGGSKSDKTLRAVADEIWGAIDGQKVTEHRLGLGRVIYGKTVAQVVAAMKIAPDFSLPGKKTNFPLAYIHRQTNDETDIYYVANTKNQNIICDCRFRVTGKIPELWDPVNGQIRRLSQFKVTDHHTDIPMEFDEQQSFFIVFKRTSSAPIKSEINFPKLVCLQELQGPWMVSFDPKWGGPERVIFDEMTDWSKHSDEGIKYYSGTAVYRKLFDFKKPSYESRIYIDLGKVENVACVHLNSKFMGIIWCKPWRVEVTDALKEKDNLLEIEITNLLPNRMIGDEQLPREIDYVRDGNHVIKMIPKWIDGSQRRESQRYTFATFNPYTKISPLLPSGVLGPLIILKEIK